MKSLVLFFVLTTATCIAPNMRAERTLPWPQAALKQEWEQATKRAREKEMSFVTELHRKIVAGSREASEAEMKGYSNIVHAVDRGHYVNPAVTNRNKPVDFGYVMVPIRGGEFMMGSPVSEAGRRADEGPQHKVKISPFWMEQCEVTWAEYEPFMLNVEVPYPPDTNYVVSASDAVAKPTKPYVEMSFGMGKQNHPAVAMTQHAANKYCEWLSAKTGHFYRLPTEAEWEYACRAGSTAAYSFGDNISNLNAYAWFAENSDGKYQKVGKKKPNPWGLHDMHGNVAEWCLDQYDPNFYAQGKGTSVSPWNKATKAFAHVVRGGAWNDTFGVEGQLRSAAREKSDKSWTTDPNLPPSIWYFDQAPFIGFRIVRPLQVPTADEMFHYWNSGVENLMPPSW